MTANASIADLNRLRAQVNYQNCTMRRLLIEYSGQLAWDQLMGHEVRSDPYDDEGLLDLIVTLCCVRKTKWLRALSAHSEASRHFRGIDQTTRFLMLRIDKLLDGKLCADLNVEDARRCTTNL